MRESEDISQCPNPKHPPQQNTWAVKVALKVEAVQAVPRLQ